MIYKYSQIQDKVNRFLENTGPTESTGSISVVGEVGINANGDLETAKKLIDVADHCGCDYVKFQKRSPEACVPEHKKNDLRETPWGEIQYIDYKHKIEFGKEEFEEIDRYCSEKNMGWFSSVWDLPSVEFMQEFTDIGKIPSPHLTNDPVLKATRESFDEMIISTGMSTQEQIDHAVDISDPSVIMHSVSSYPTNVDEISLEYIKYLRESFPEKEIGYSGHEKGVVSSAAAVALGVDWVERHITLSTDLWGSDQSLSLEPSELNELVSNIRKVEKAMGGNKKREILPSEKTKKKSLRKNS